MHRRRLLPLLPLLALAGPRTGRAQGAPRRWALLSEIARELRIVIEQPPIGSNLSQNLVEKVPVAGAALDRIALVLGKAELARADPGAPVRSFDPLDADVFDAQRSFERGSDAGMPADLADALRQLGSTHLLLLTRHRAEAAIQALNSKEGVGRLEGLGFYINKHTQVDVRDADVSGRRGYLAPYVYLRATVIDAATRRVLATEVHTRAWLIASDPSKPSAHPWDALDTKEKMRALAGGVEQALSALVPRLVAAI